MQENPPASQTPPNAPSFALRGQYIKDLSFENPRAPESLIGSEGKPSIEVNVDLKAQKLQESVYELVLHVTARAITDNKSLFLVDLSYAGIFAVANIPAEHVEQVLLVDGPFVLFPFARRVIADVTRDGGFPPLMLDPIDFASLYAQNARRTSAAAS